jgi:hypothetical protein
MLVVGCRLPQFQVYAHYALSLVVAVSTTLMQHWNAPSTKHLSQVLHAPHCLRLRQTLAMRTNHQCHPLRAHAQVAIKTDAAQAYVVAKPCSFAESQAKEVIQDNHGQSWSYDNGLMCAFKSPNEVVTPGAPKPNPEGPVNINAG